ncbi:MAG: flagellar biosynthetic protein FliR [Deltaproteobacteria bacterium]|nr:flagellar biosynthetic protein FliR [Deltaproteobacteria bacterium]
MKISIGSDAAFCFGLIFARVGAVMVAMPQMLGVGIPLKLRLLLAMLLAGALMAHATAALPTFNGLIPIAVSVGRELAIGASLAFVTALVVGAVLMVGDLFGIGMELNSGGILRGTALTPNVLADGLSTLAGLIFFIGGFHRILLVALARSLEVMPLGVLTLPQVTTMIAASGRLFVIALDLALPLMVPVLIITVAEGVIVRLVPQINVLVAAPAAIVLAGLVLLGLDSLGLVWGITRAWSSMMTLALGLLNG